MEKLNTKMKNRGLLNDLEDLLKKPIKKCNIAIAIEAVTDEERDMLQKLLDSNISADKLAVVLKSHGFSASHSTVYRHRNKMCVCVVNQ